jgi:hypothetical protein
MALVWLVAAPVTVLRTHCRFVDFCQFYMGGTIARERAWDSLYPIPRPESTQNPGGPADSDMRPGYAELARKHGVGDGMRFIQPPPAAVLSLPLALVPYRTSMLGWAMLLGAATWGVAVFAARLLSRLLGRASRWEGGLILLIAFSPRSLATIAWGNASPLIALIIAVTAWGIMDGRSRRGGAALALGGSFKYAPLVLVPLALAARRWRMLIHAAIISSCLFGLSLVVMGTGPFVTFHREIVPTLGRSFSEPGLNALSLRSLAERLFPAWRSSIILLIAIAGATALGLILFLLFRRPAKVWRHPVNVAAASGVLVVWFLIFSPVFWNHYLIYLMPFWGWMLWEGRSSWLRRGIAIAAVIVAFAPWKIVYGALLRSHAPAILGTGALWSALLLFALALPRMVRPLVIEREEQMAPIADYQEIREPIRENRNRL